MVGLRAKLESAKPAIEAAIRDAESKTAGEIVIVICRVAGIYSWHEAIFSFLVSLVAMSLCWWKWQAVIQASTWSGTPALQFHLGWVVLTLVLGFMLGEVLVRLFPKIVAAFASRSSMRRHAENAATLAYRRYQIERTTGKTGVMIFLAEMEQTVVVMGDDRISETIQPSDWASIRDRILDGVKHGRPAEGVITAIGQAGDLLARTVPPNGDDRNELQDRIYFC